MGLPPAILVLLLLRSALSLTDESFEGFDLSNPEDESEIDSLLDRQARNSDKFLRFGKAFWDYDSTSDNLSNGKQLQRPSRTGRQGKNDHFIRFGRSKQEFLRFTGDPQQRTVRDQSSFLRFGRSVGDGSKKKRDKREISSKRHENFLRFGRTSNSNFMRFGRNLSPMDYQKNSNVLNYLRSLLRQSEENNRHRV
ncbi:FMRFamide-like neuropeptides 1 isoform X1 [Euwallacea fornicatus]|uniref:FMRFamide-like neuropeptides 1 isoform X1 n=1 Tax=Euwallacea fornicatus TaxID=995702 RepID=UPI00338D8EA8